MPSFGFVPTNQCEKSEKIKISKGKTSNNRCFRAIFNKYFTRKIRYGASRGH